MRACLWADRQNIGERHAGDLIETWPQVALPLWSLHALESQFLGGVVAADGRHQLGQHIPGNAAAFQARSSTVEPNVGRVRAGYDGGGAERAGG